MIETNFIDTEIGKVPADWAVVSLDSLFDFGNGYTPSKAIANYWVNGTIPWFRMEDIRLNGRILSDSIQHITPEAVKGGGLFPANSIILSTTATIGEHALITVDSLANQRFTFLMRKVKRENDIDLMFFFHYCFLLGEWCRANINDGGLMAVNMKDLKSCMLPLPPLPEQRRIASALSSIDNLISALDKLIEKKCAIKTGAMQELLGGKRRVKGCEGEWKSVRLGEGLIFQCGAPFESSYFNTESIGMRLIKNRDLKSDDQVYFYSGEYSDEYIVRNGDLLVGMDGDFLPCIWNKGEALLNQRVGRIKSDIWSIPFLYYILMEPLKIKQAGTGATTVKHLSHGDIESMSILLPSSLEEQRAIASVLTAMDDELAALEAKKAKYVALKQGMMQQLLTGKIRLIDSFAK